MYNLNPRYALINYDINVAKDWVSTHDILDLCPRMVIPVGTLLYHSTKLSRADIVNFKKYPPKKNCAIYQLPLPKTTESIGDKPHIMELSVNPNKRNGHCTCQYGQQKRLYGNFNFVGNYELGLNTTLKGVEILIVTEPITLIDLNYPSIELGFSPKTFTLHGNDLSGHFAKQTQWQNYCTKHHIDGLIMLDASDIQSITMEHKMSLSCYHYRHGVACPEFVLLSSLGETGMFPVGTDKLKILGMIDIDQLSRQEVDKLFKIFFTKLQYHFKKITISYPKPNTLFKILNPGTSIEAMFNYLTSYIDRYGDADFYLNRSHLKDAYDHLLYQSDIEYLKEYTEKQLELFDPAKIDMELWTDIIIKNLVPKSNACYYFKDGLVTHYASDKIFDALLYDAATSLKINPELYIHFPELYQFNPRWHLVYFLESFKDRLDKSIIEIMLNVEKEMIIEFFRHCGLEVDKIPAYVTESFRRDWLYLKNNVLTFNKNVCELHFFTALYNQSIGMEI